MTQRRNQPSGFVLVLTITLLIAPLRCFAHARPDQASLQAKLDHARALAQRGELAAAEREYLAAIRLDPRSYEAHNDLGALYMSERRYEPACVEFARAAQLNETAAPVQQNLGLCSIQANHFAEAANALKKAEALDPQDLRTRYFLGYSLFTLNRPDEAEPELEYVLQRRPGDDSTLFYLIRIYTGKKDYEKAADAFRALSQAHPDSVFVHILNGESYDLQDRTKDAIEEFRKALALAPEMPRLHFGLGFLYWEDQRFDAAAAELKQELRINPHFAPANYYLGDIALNRSDFAAAQDFFARAVSESPACLDAHVGLGKTYARAGRWQKALEEFQLADKIDSGQRDVHYWLGTTLRHLGRQTESRKEMEIYQEIAGKIKSSGAAGGVRKERSTAKSCLPHA
jgi:tetratricopeptide (TPR) repeat protein